MTDVFLTDLAFSLGSRRVTIEDSVAAGLASSEPSVLKEVGFRYHHVCVDGETAYSLAKRTAESMSLEPSRIGAIVYATCLPCNSNVGDETKFVETRDVKHFMDFPASHLQADLALDRAFVIGLAQQACTGMLGSLRIAQMLLGNDASVDQVLCITSDRFPPGAGYEQAYNLVSDGAAACVVSTKPPGYRLLTHHAITNGALAQASDDETVGTFFNYMNRLIGETLRKAELEMGDIHWIVPQNMNVKAWKILSRVLGVDPERVYFGSLPEVAHVISGDNIINLKKLEEEQRIRSGERLLLCMAGFGLDWQAVILEKY